MKKLIGLLTVLTLLTQSTFIVFAEEETVTEDPQEPAVTEKQEEDIIDNSPVAEDEEFTDSEEVRIVKKVIEDLRKENELPEFTYSKELSKVIEDNKEDPSALEEDFNVYDFSVETSEYAEIYETLEGAELILAEEPLELGVAVTEDEEDSFTIYMISEKQESKEAGESDAEAEETAVKTDESQTEEAVETAAEEETKELIAEKDAGSETVLPEKEIIAENDEQNDVFRATLVSETSLPFALESVSGFVKADDAVYYVDPVTHQLLKGQKKINGYWYYFDPSTGKMATGFVDLNGDKTVYYCEAGYMLYGMQTIDGNKYYFEPWTGAMKTQQKKLDGYYYYFDDETGAMVTGWKEIPSQNKTVYYDKSGHMLYGFQVIDSKKYYFNLRTGAMEKNQKKINGYYYYFDDETGAMVTGWKEIPSQNKTVYYDKSGHMLYGFQVINSKKYYFNPRTGAMEKNQKKINGYYYYFDDETGVMITGWKEIPAQNKTVYYDKNGRMVYGTYVIDGVPYFFHPRTGALLDDGFRKVPGPSGSTIMVFVKDGEIMKRNFKYDQVYYQVDENTGEIIHQQKLFTDAIYMEGIDISEHNGSIDLSAYQNGFVIIRIGWWTTPDKMAIRNMDLCDKYNIPYGVYLYDYTTDPEDAVKEAEFTLKMIEGRNVRCGVWFDMEDDGWRARNGVPPSHPNISKLCQAYCRRIEQAGYHVGIYASYSWFENYITGCDRWDKWVAHWGSNDGNWNVNLSGYAPMHQFTSVPLDRNVIYVDLSHFR